MRAQVSFRRYRTSSVESPKVVQAKQDNVNVNRGATNSVNLSGADDKIAKQSSVERCTNPLSVRGFGSTYCYPALVRPNRVLNSYYIFIHCINMLYEAMANGHVEAKETIVSALEPFRKPITAPTMLTMPRTPQTGKKICTHNFILSSRPEMPK